MQTLLIATIVSLTASVTLAREPYLDAEERVEHAFSVTVSPVHMLLPMVEVTGEVRLSDQIGLSLLGGAGRVTVRRIGGTPTEDVFSAYELGSQLRYYVVGNFDHGMQVGAEALYLWVERQARDTVSASGEGLAVGPFVGYKIATDVGFTFDAQLGIERLLIQANASESGSGASAADSDERWIPLLNLNVGWSF